MDFMKELLNMGSDPQSHLQHSWDNARPDLKEIIERIMTMHWDMKACCCWVCEAGRKAGCHANESYLDWRGKF